MKKKHKNNGRSRRRLDQELPFEPSTNRSERPLRKLAKERKDPNKITDFDSLRRYFDIKPDEWDAIIVTDGSGTTWEKEAGWGATLIQNETFRRVPFYGGMSHGTNNIAELMAVLHPLMFLTSHKAGVDPKGYRVHVVSDSEYVVKGLRETDPAWSQGLKSNREIWMAMHMTRRSGMIITSHHLKRDTVDLNRVAHDLANLGRRSQIKLLEKLDHDIYEANPQ